MISMLATKSRWFDGVVHRRVKESARARSGKQPLSRLGSSEPQAETEESGSAALNFPCLFLGGGAEEREKRLVDQEKNKKK